MSSAKGEMDVRRREVTDVEAVRDIHITSYISAVSGETIISWFLGFIYVLLQEARPVNPTAHNSLSDSIHQKASTSIKFQSATAANEKGKDEK